MKQKLLCMRHAWVLLVACLTLLIPWEGAAAPSPQQTLVRIGNVTSLKELIRQIESQTSYRVSYQGDLADNVPVKIERSQKSVEQLLDETLRGTGISYTIRQNSIILTRTSAQKPVAAVQAHLQLTGVVTDATTGEPIVGATVLEVKASNAAITNIKGEFQIHLKKGHEIEVSYVGYKKSVLDVGNLGFIEVKLESDSELETVVVVGAGSQKKVSVTGAITSIIGDQLRAPSSSLTSNLAGKLPGIISITNSGEPGKASEFYIRGIGTFGGRTTPLILLDDVEISADDLNRIPVETIQSFTILKDASATAIYGVRGANGVMLVITKTGNKNTKTKIGVTVENSFVQPMRFPKFADGGTWMDLYNQALLARGGTTDRYTREEIDLTRSHKYPYAYPDVDWQKVLFRDFNMNQRANVNVTGGGNKVTYYMSLNFNHDAGIVNAPKDYVFNNNVQHYRYNFQNNITYELSNTTKLSLNLNAQVGQKEGLGENPNDLFDYMYKANPVLFPVTLPSEEGDDHIRFGTIQKQGTSYFRNPYAMMLDDYAVTKDNKLNASLKVDQNLDFVTKGLAIQGLVNWNSFARTKFTQKRTPYYYTVENVSAEDPSIFNAVQYKPGNLYIDESYSEPYTDQTFYFDARLTYDRTFGRHNVSGLLMYMMREFRPNKSLPQRNQGLSGRTTYNFDQRYFIEFNFGYNGTERLAKENRFEFFPAVSFGWVPSNEKFWAPLKDYVDYLKIRGSYGLVGSDGFNNFSHFTYFDEVNLGGGGSYYFGPDPKGSMPGFTSPGIEAYAVDGATWERVKKTDIGVDLSLFRQVNITFDYFKDKRESIMLKRGSWPYVMGYWNAVPWGQVGEAENHGVELSLNWSRKLGRDWQIDLRANYTYTQNKYIEYDEPDYPSVWKTYKGKPLSAYRVHGYIAEGLFADDADVAHSADHQLGSQVRPGDIKYRDVSGDGIINEEDEVMISPYGRRPRIQYGFGVNLRWRNWDLGVFFNGSAKRSLYINGITPFGDDLCNVMSFIAEDYWSESNPNPNARYPRLGVNANDVKNNSVISTYWLRNGNFLRFKTLELGYNFKYGRVYVNGDNLAVWSPFKLWDPELAWNAYPLSRTFTLGVQLKF